MFSAALAGGKSEQGQGGSPRRLGFIALCSTHNLHLQHWNLGTSFRTQCGANVCDSASAICQHSRKQHLNFFFLLLQISFPVCCKAQQESQFWRKAGRWQEDALVLGPNCTFSGKHITTVFLWIMWISGMWLGQRETLCPHYKQSSTYSWSRCTQHCATLRAQPGVMRIVKRTCSQVCQQKGKALLVGATFVSRSEVEGRKIFINISGDLLTKTLRQFKIQVWIWLLDTDITNTKIKGLQSRQISENMLKKWP